MAHRSSHPPVLLRMQLNTFYSGPQAWFFLAAQRGYLADVGIELEFVEGDTAANTVPKMAAGGFDVGYGDINALVEYVGHGRPNPPVAVFASYNQSPYTVAVPAASAITQPQQLAGKRLVTHPADAAWLLFPEFCKATGLDASSVQVDINAAPHSELVPRLLAGEWQGLFGFVNTLAAASLDAGLTPQQLRHLDYASCVPDLYGMALMVMPSLVQQQPDVVRALVQALNQGFVDAVADPEASIDALLAQAPHAAQASNLQRWLGTLKLEMAHAEGASLGLGDVDDARFARGIALIAQTKRLPVQPSAAAIFDRQFLPPLAKRIRHLARL
jgi:NitT/TauT family transport system substrate-binding protein